MKKDKIRKELDYDKVNSKKHKTKPQRQNRLTKMDKWDPELVYHKPKF